MEKEKDIRLIEFGNTVKRIRISKGLTQVEISSKMNRDQQSLQRVESGRVNLSYTYILELATALEINPRDFFSE